MGSTKAIKQRRKTTQNIHKITRTMELVATAKLKVANRLLGNFIPYKQRALAMLNAVVGTGGDHWLLQCRSDTANVVIFAIAGNKGLCGSYNTRIVDAAIDWHRQLMAEDKQVALHLTGRKAIIYSRFQQVPLADRHGNLPDQPTFASCQPLAQKLMEDFVQHRADEVWLLFTRKMKLQRERLLPLPVELSGDWQAQVTAQEYSCAPNADSLLAELVPMCVRLKLYEAFLQAAVSEQTSRMLAMKMASENAEDMIKRLTREYNRARQAQITQEILEILAGAEHR